MGVFDWHVDVLVSVQNIQAHYPVLMIATLDALGLRAWL